MPSWNMNLAHSGCPYENGFRAAAEVPALSKWWVCEGKGRAAPTRWLAG